MSAKGTLDIILGHVALACAEVLRARGETESPDDASEMLDAALAQVADYRRRLGAANSALDAEEVVKIHTEKKEQRWRDEAACLERERDALAVEVDRLMEYTKAARKCLGATTNECLIDAAERVAQERDEAKRNVVRLRAMTNDIDRDRDEIKAELRKLRGDR